jgi:uncharacterized membrane protein YebE (DUF533 family)
MKRITLSGDACVETLALLIAMAWADGLLADHEKASIRAAADVFNLTRELRVRLDSLMEKPMPIDQLLVESLTSRERAFGYVAAAWMTGVDDDVDPKEVELLDRVASVLAIDDAQKKDLTSLARELEPRKGKRDWANEVVRLFKAIPAHLEGIGTADVDVIFA